MRAGFTVKCDAGYHYSPDCTNRCQDFRNCADCGLTWFTGEFCNGVLDILVLEIISGKIHPCSGFMCTCNQDYTMKQLLTIVSQ